MNIHIVTDGRRAMIISQHCGVVVVPYDGLTLGNPYMRFSPIIREHLGVNALKTKLTVSQVTSGDLERWVSR